MTLPRTPALGPSRADTARSIDSPRADAPGIWRSVTAFPYSRIAALALSAFLLAAPLLAPVAPVRGQDASTALVPVDRDPARAQAIANSGMVPDHAEAVSKAAQQRSETVFMQATNKSATGKIAEGAGTKDMNMKPKSASGGPADGWIPVDQTLSSKVRTPSEADLRHHGSPEAVRDYYNSKVQKLVESGHYAPVQVPSATDPSTTVTVLGRVGPDGKAVPITADYDMLTVGRRKDPGSVQPDPGGRLGNVSADDVETIQALNAVTGRTDNPVVHHGHAAGAPVDPGINYPVTVFQDDGKVVSIPKGPEGDPHRNLREYVEFTHRATAIQVPLHKDWNDLKPNAPDAPTTDVAGAKPPEGTGEPARDKALNDNEPSKPVDQAGGKPADQDGAKGKPDGETPRDTAAANDNDHAKSEDKSAAAAQPEGKAQHEGASAETGRRPAATGTDDSRPAGQGGLALLGRETEGDRKPANDNEPANRSDAPSESDPSITDLLGVADVDRPDDADGPRPDDGRTPMQLAQALDQQLAERIGVTDRLPDGAGATRRQFNDLMGKVNEINDAIGKVADAQQALAVGQSVMEYLATLSMCADGSISDAEANFYCEDAAEQAREMIRTGMMEAGMGLLAQAFPTVAAAIGAFQTGYDGTRWFLENTETGQRFERGFGMMADDTVAAGEAFSDSMRRLLGVRTDEQLRRDADMRRFWSIVNAAERGALPLPSDVAFGDLGAAFATGGIDAVRALIQPRGGLIAGTQPPGGGNPPVRPPPGTPPGTPPPGTPPGPLGTGVTAVTGGPVKAFVPPALDPKNSGCRQTAPSDPSKPFATGPLTGSGVADFSPPCPTDTSPVKTAAAAASPPKPGAANQQAAAQPAQRPQQAAPATKPDDFPYRHELLCQDPKTREACLSRLKRERACQTNPEADREFCLSGCFERIGRSRAFQNFCSPGEQLALQLPEDERRRQRARPPPEPQTPTQTAAPAAPPPAPARKPQSGDKPQPEKPAAGKPGGSADEQGKQSLTGKSDTIGKEAVAGRQKEITDAKSATVEKSAALDKSATVEKSAALDKSSTVEKSAALDKSAAAEKSAIQDKSITLDKEKGILVAKDKLAGLEAEWERKEKAAGLVESVEKGSTPDRQKPSETAKPGPAQQAQPTGKVAASPASQASKPAAPSSQVLPQQQALAPSTPPAAPRADVARKAQALIQDIEQQQAAEPGKKIAPQVLAPTQKAEQQQAAEQGKKVTPQILAPAQEVEKKPVVEPGKKITPQVLALTQQVEQQQAVEQGKKVTPQILAPAQEVAKKPVVEPGKKITPQILAPAQEVEQQQAAEQGKKVTPQIQAPAQEAEKRPIVEPGKKITPQIQAPAQEAVKTPAPKPVKNVPPQVAAVPPGGGQGKTPGQPGATTPPPAAQSVCSVPYTPVRAGEHVGKQMTVGGGQRCGGTYRIGVLALASPPRHGTVTIDGGRYVYTPRPGYVGPDSFTLVNRWESNGQAASAQITYNVTVVTAPPKTAAAAAPRPAPQPICIVQPMPMNAGQHVRKPMTVSSGDPCRGSVASGIYVLAAPARNGTVAIDGGRYVYTSRPGYKGPDSFTLTNHWQWNGQTWTAHVTYDVTVVDAPSGAAAAR